MDLYTCTCTSTIGIDYSLFFMRAIFLLSNLKKESSQHSDFKRTERRDFPEE